MKYEKISHRYDDKSNKLIIVVKISKLFSKSEKEYISSGKQYAHFNHLDSFYEYPSFKEMKLDFKLIGFLTDCKRKIEYDKI